MCDFCQKATTKKDIWKVNLLVFTGTGATLPFGGQSIRRSYGLKFLLPLPVAFAMPASQQQ